MPKRKTKKVVRAWAVAWKGILQDEDPWDRMFIYRKRKGALEAVAEECHYNDLDNSTVVRVTITIEN